MIIIEVKCCSFDSESLQFIEQVFMCRSLTLIDPGLGSVGLRSLCVLTRRYTRGMCRHRGSQSQYGLFSLHRVNRTKYQRRNTRSP